MGQNLQFWCSSVLHRPSYSESRVYQTTLLQVKNRACDSVEKNNTKVESTFVQILENIEVKWWV